MATTNRSVIAVGLLVLSAITLKLTHVITWSWWLVLLPIWLPWTLIAAFLVIIFIAACTVELVHFFSGD